MSTSPPPPKTSDDPSPSLTLETSAPLALRPEARLAAETKGKTRCTPSNQGKTERAAEDTLRLEYQEINSAVRTDDTTTWAIGGVMLTLAVAILAAAKDSSSGERILVGLVSIGFCGFWVLIKERSFEYQGVRLTRAREIEKRLRMNHHRAIERAGAPGSVQTHKLIRVSFWIFAVAVALWIALGFL